MPHILQGTAQPGDTYLICTDGLAGMLEDGELRRILAEHLAENGAEGGAEAPLRALVDAANAAGGHDNITAALVRLAGG